MATAPSPAQQESTKFSQICRNCKVPTAIIEDHQQGDLVCTECGLVLESRVVDETSEWRTFSDSDKAGADPNRTAGPTNKMLAGGGLSTAIGKNPDGTYNQTLTRLHNRGANPDRAMINAFSKINEMADHLGMTSVVKDGACDLYRMVVKPGQPLVGKSHNAMYAACLQFPACRDAHSGCQGAFRDSSREETRSLTREAYRTSERDPLIRLYTSCRQEGTNRTFKEICGGAPNTTVKEIGRCYKFIIREIDGLNIQMMEQMITPEKLTNRFCGNLGLANLEFLKLATAVIATFRNLRISEGHKSEKQPASVAAAAIWMCVQIMGQAEEINLQRISEVSGMAEGTIRVSYEDMYPYATRLLPAAYVEKMHLLTAPTLDKEEQAAISAGIESDEMKLLLPPI